MNCEKTAEFVSALCDGELIPREAAEHLGTCGECTVRLNDYVLMGVELKRMAVATAPQSVREVSWGPQERAKSSWAQMWSGSMRIPRFAFGAMLISIVMLVAGIALTRAQARELWFQFEVRERRGSVVEVGLMSAEPKGRVPDPGPVIINSEREGTLTLIVRVLEARNGSEKLGVRALWLPRNSDLTDLDKKIQSSPEAE